MLREKNSNEFFRAGTVFATPGTGTCLPVSYACCCHSIIIWWNIFLSFQILCLNGGFSVLWLLPPHQNLFALLHFPIICICCFSSLCVVWSSIIGLRMTMMLSFSPTILCRIGRGPVLGETLVTFEIKNCFDERFSSRTLISFCTVVLYNLHKQTNTPHTQHANKQTRRWWFYSHRLEYGQTSE